MPSKHKTYIKTMWLIYLSLAASCMLFFVGINYGMLGELPTFEDLETPKTALASEIYDNKGVLLGRYYIEDRTNADPSEIPQALIDALISVEDVRFYEHSGIDMRSMWRVLIKTFLLMVVRKETGKRVAQGGLVGRAGWAKTGVDAAKAAVRTGPQQGRISCWPDRPRVAAFRRLPLRSGSRHRGPGHRASAHS